MTRSKLLSAVSVFLLLWILIPANLPVYGEEFPSEQPETIEPDADWPTRSDGTTPSGAANDPYLIEDAADLLAFKSKRTDKNVGNNNYKGKYIVLTNDIDLNPGWDAGSMTAPGTVWSEFYEFSGVLDGKGHTISGLWFSGSAYVGFIRNGTDCTVRNLTVDNSVFISAGSVCGFVATLKGTSVLEGITLESGFTAKGNYSVGGLLGNAYTGTEHTVRNCTFKGTVICAGNYAGGLLGDTYNGTQFTLENCCSGGTVISGGSYAGGIVGNVSKSTTFLNCAFNGTVSAADFSGGLVGRNAALLSMEDCVSFGTVRSAANAAGILGLCKGKAVLTRCVSVSSLVSDLETTAEFLTEYRTSASYAEAEKTLRDCYALTESGIRYYDAGGTLSCSALSILYGGEAAAQFLCLAERSQLPDNAAFSADGSGYYGWTVHADTVMPQVVKDLLTEHTFAATYHEATCAESDHTDLVCTTCGYSYTEWGYEKADHTSEAGWIYDPYPTEDTGGKRYQVCDVCQAVYDVEYVPIEGAVYQVITDWGKDATTVYRISSAAELMSFAAKRVSYSNYQDARVILTADIDLNPGWDAASGLRPTNILTYLFEFDGIFDGQGHTISGLYIEGNPQNNMAYACFINKLSNATVRNVRIVNSCFATEGNYAGLFGTAQGNVTIENVFADVIVRSAKYAGGILTQINTSSTVTMKNVVFAGSVSSSSVAGGILGWDNGQTIQMTACAIYGNVTVTEDICGGLIGQVSGNVSLTGCYAGGSVGGGRTQNAAVCYANKPAALVLSDCYIDAALSSLSPVAGNTGSAYSIGYGGTASESFLFVNGPSGLEAVFDGWIVSNDGKYAVPEALFCYVNGHEMTYVVTPPTCFSRGFTTGTCSYCGIQSIVDYTEPVDHTPSEEWIIDSPATETRMGSKHLECAVCGEVLDQAIIPKLKTEETEPDKTEPVTDATTEVPEPGKGCASGISFPAFLVPVLLLGIGLLEYQRKKRIG